MQRLIKEPRHKRLLVLAIVILILVILAGLRILEAIRLRRESRLDSLVNVSVIESQKDFFHHTIVLPGTVYAWHQAPIYARTNGYIKNWYVDIGSKVKKGDLLTLIETPELNAQLRQAEADLKVAVANNELAQTTARRWVSLRKTDSVSQQETEEKVDTAAAQEAAVVSRRANRDRLLELVSFERVIAPFDGTISDRNTDIGALINLGSSPSQQQPLFRLVQLDPLRLYIKIPQNYSSRIQDGMHIALQFSEHPGKTFSAKLLTTANAIEPNSRTLLAQFLVENKTGALLPGAYTEVALTVPSFPEALRLPINSLIFRKDGLQVACIDKNNRVQLKKTTVHKDFGNYVEINSGIEAGERIVINPSDAIFTGQSIHIAEVVAPNKDKA